MPHDGTPIGTVQSLYRYPVKSTAGQAVDYSAVTARGLRHDRGWAVYTDDGGIASGKRTQRFRPVPGLMQWTSRTDDEAGGPTLESPQGQRFRVGDPAASRALSEAFGRFLELRPETTVQHHDETPLHVLTTSSLAALGNLSGSAVDERRFRANIVIDTQALPAFAEDGWTGAELALGNEVVLRLGPGMPRCVMIDQPQASVPAAGKTLKLLGLHHGTEFGLQAYVRQGGMLRVGDAVFLR